MHRHPSIKPSLTDKLCTHCGLCCDGSLFADVELASGAEASALEVMGLEIEDGDDDEASLLLQPCTALKGKRCTIYPHRPNCCRTFECRLLQEVKRGVVGIGLAKVRIAEALQRIERVNDLAVQLGVDHKRLPLKERCQEAMELSEAAAADPEIKRKRTELQATVAAVESLIQKTFLAA